MKLVIDIPWQIKECLNNENEWTALLLAELKNIVNNGIPLEKEPKTDLDKIRAEIADLIDDDESYYDNDPDDYYKGYYEGVIDAIQVIIKYS